MYIINSKMSFMVRSSQKEAHDKRACSEGNLQDFDDRQSIRGQRQYKTRQDRKRQDRTEKDRTGQHNTKHCKYFDLCIGTVKSCKVNIFRFLSFK